MSFLGWYAIAALAEITGCFTFWSWLREGKSIWWIVPGVGCLCLFALALTRVDAAFAGRTFAAYGGIYILASLLWGWLVERGTLDRWDMIGAVLVVAGTLVILLGPRPI